MSVRRSCGMDDCLSRAVDRARQLNGTEIVVAAAWKQKRMLGEMVESHIPNHRDETIIREYIKNQENEDQKLEQLNLWR